MDEKRGPRRASLEMGEGKKYLFLREKYINHRKKYLFLSLIYVNRRRKYVFPPEKYVFLCLIYANGASIYAAFLGS